MGWNPTLEAEGILWRKGYQPGSRGQIDDDSPANHTGFRWARDGVERE